MPKENVDQDIEMEIPFHTLNVMGDSSQSKNTKKLGKVESSYTTKQDNKEDDDDTPHFQSLISNNCLEEGLVSMRRFMEQTHFLLQFTTPSSSTAATPTAQDYA